MGWFDFLPWKSDPNVFEMTEGMWGYVAEGAASCREGYENGKETGGKLEYEVTLHVDNFKEFKAPSNRRAPMDGWVTWRGLFGDRRPIRNGEYGLYVLDQSTGERRITYKFDVTGDNGQDYHFDGYKVIVHEPWKFDVLDDQTTLYATITRSGESGSASVAKGIIHYHVEDFPQMVLSIRTPGDDSLINRVRMATKFFAFVSKEVSEYVREVNPFYASEYTNMVLSGTAEADVGSTEFFFFSGAHDKGFPWGDNVGFADIGLALRDGGSWRRFALTEYAIDALQFRLSEGTYDYEGPLYEITEGFQTSFSDMHGSDLPAHLRMIDAKITLRFTPAKICTRRVPFELDRGKLDNLPKDLGKAIRKSDFYKLLRKKQDDFATLGYSTEVHRLTGASGQFELNGVRYTVAGALGQGEFGKLAGLRKPVLYYNYFCAVEPEADLFRIQVRSDVLRTLSGNLLVRESERVFGQVIGAISRLDLLVRSDQDEDIEPEVADRLIVPGEGVLEINNDHYPTGTFQRRIVSLPGVGGSRALALEEDMSNISAASIGSDRTATVASVKDPDRFNALDRVLEATRFFDLLAEAQARSGKSKEAFSIIIKPNFSFMYSLTDITTFTDPRLVEHLADRIHQQGYRDIAVAEAQSTYTVFFTNRDVPTLAKYIGLKGGNYRVIDLSENVVSYDFGGTLGTHEVHPAWRDADFRISFAKNKTHSYAYYTLTIKNIYGALPKKDKFKEYHCHKGLGIFAPTIDFIDAFPIHFGLIDAYFSADGPFGIFADPKPNFTSTVIGGDDIVAVDWVGSSKMGYDPMVSEYMQLAVERFGKPAIRLIGDASPYSPWVNVPEIVSKAAFAVMDNNYIFGNFLYSAAATMDPFFTFTPDEVSRKIARVFTTPVRKVLFDWVSGGKPQLTKDDLTKLLDPEQKEYVEKLIGSLG